VFASGGLGRWCIVANVFGLLEEAWSIVREIAGPIYPLPAAGEVSDDGLAVFMAREWRDLPLHCPDSNCRGPLGAEQ
jgi:hypothetical protein